MKVYLDEAKAFQLFRKGDQTKELQLEPTPILSLTNPVRVRDPHGAVFAWLHEGRPEALGAIWSVIAPNDPTKRRISNEFHSLSLVPLFSKHEQRIGQHGVVPDWNANKPGIDRKLIPLSQPPAKTVAQRLTQMRRMARGFQAEFLPSAGGVQDSLRLLPQPIMRYQSEAQGVTDGGVFAFVMGTDPELLLLIESVKTPDGNQWHYGAAQFTNLPLILKHQDVKVWECGKANPFNGEGPHYMYWGVSVRDKIIE